MWKTHAHGKDLQACLNRDHVFRISNDLACQKWFKKIRYSHVMWQVNFHSHLSTLSSINTFPIQLLRSRSNYNKSSLAHLCGGMETWLKAKSQWLRIVSSGRRQDPSFEVTWYGRHRSIIYQGDRLGSFAPGPPFEQLDVLAHYLLSSRSISECWEHD